MRIRRSKHKSSLLSLKINIDRAANLVSNEQLTKTSINPICQVHFNNKKYSTSKKLNTNQPSWDDSITIPLKKSNSSSILILSVWDKHKRYKTYLGELRLSIQNLFLDGSKFSPMVELKWYKLSSNASIHSFTTGSILCSFELIRKTDDLQSSFKEWINEIIIDETLIIPNDQGFYNDALIDDTSTDVESNIEDVTSISESSIMSSDENIFNTSPKKSKFRKSKKLKGFNGFELSSRSVMGVLFIEILSCEDLPPLTNFTRTTFDMDPFVVVTFGKKTFRTSWKRHTLNPIFNERLAFEVLNNESNYNIQFNILDKDHFSFHDKVASISLPVKDLTNNATVIDDSEEEGFTTGDNENKSVKILEDDNLHSIERKRRLKRKKVISSYVDTSKFKVLLLSLVVKNEKYQEHNSTLKIRVRFETYFELRKKFWKYLLDQYKLEDTDDFDYFELISLLDTLGCLNSDELIETFFSNLGKSSWGGDKLTTNETIQQLEQHIISNQNPNDKIFEIERCPICDQQRFNKKQDLDIITHFAICASKDWSIVNKLLVNSYVSPTQATKKWFSKALIKLTYGKYKLGGNSANILVQDRLTGIILEEKMSVYVRLGIRLLYKGLDKAKSKPIRILLKKLSVKQGKKFDSPNSKNDIASFIKFHKLDLSDCLITDPTQFETFNTFFFRKLKKGARPIEGNEDIIVSPADCRCAAFETVNDATNLWIKGRNFTLPKLFNSNQFENTNLAKSSECSLGVFRLAPQDYHRFHSPVTGIIKDIKHIDGEYYTVNPMAIRSELDVFGENVRSIIPIKTEQFGTVIMIAIGAMMVGSIVLSVKPGDPISRGDEVGYFKFGGSTIILLIEKQYFQFDSDLINNSSQCIETLCRVGQSIGHNKKINEISRDHVDFDKLDKSKKINLIRVLTGGDINDVDKLSNWEATNLINDLSLEDNYDLDSEESIE
ncbi:unnamed protein product [Candida verbasci]|uniref:Phosphatidylserine decarboxylase proenzyme 2 n=1 Tax=Candida verbasci TaxID=1227364 RepID=A0A9W4TZ73_9ASCO|nr:unnamed protein product [Candida verbasci]